MNIWKNQDGVGLMDVLISLVIISITSAYTVDHYFNQKLDLELAGSALVTKENNRALKKNISAHVQRHIEQLALTNCGFTNGTNYPPPFELAKLGDMSDTIISPRLKSMVNRCKDLPALPIKTQSNPVTHPNLAGFSGCYYMQDIDDNSGQSGFYKLIVEYKVVFWDFNTGEPLTCGAMVNRPGRGAQILYSAQTVKKMRSTKYNKQFVSDGFSGKFYLPKQIFSETQEVLYDIE